MIKMLGVGLAVFSFTMSFNPSSPQWDMGSVIVGVVVSAVVIGVLAGPIGVTVLTACVVGVACGGAAAYLYAIIYVPGAGVGPLTELPSDDPLSVLISFEPEAADGPRKNRIAIMGRNGDTKQPPMSLQAETFDALIRQFRALLVEKQQHGLREVVLRTSPYPGLDFVQKTQQMCSELGLKFSQESEQGAGKQGGIK